MAATKTTTKKVVKKAKSDAPKEKSLAVLQAELAAKRQDLFDARRSHVARELVNPRVITATRKEIAQIMTAIRAAEIAANKEAK